MKTCPECGRNENKTKFYRKSTHCQDCNESYAKGVLDLVREHYQPEYPKHIQDYLNKRQERLEKQEK